MKRRIFIAIDLPPKLKREISEAIAQWRWLPIRWLAPESWHVTLVPPVYLSGAEVEVLSALIGRVRFGKPFSVRFSRVVLAPAGVATRMIWLEGNAPPELLRLKKKLEAAWGSTGELPPLKPEDRPFRFHITLARFQPGELKELELKTRMLGEVNFRLGVEVTVMESHLKPSGAEYERLAVAPL